MDKSDVLGIIPARYGSTRFPGKPLAMIAGKPMIQRVYEQAIQALPFVVITTDDTRIFNAAKQFTVNVVMTPENCTSGTNRCAIAYEHVKWKWGLDFKAVINIQGDVPFFVPKQIDKLIECFESGNTGIATLVKPIDNEEELFDDNKVKVVIDINGEALYFSRQPIPYLTKTPTSEWCKYHNYLSHVGMYIFEVNVLQDIYTLEPSPLEKGEALEQLTWLFNGYSIRVTETYYPNTSIDTPEDLEKITNIY